ncbi:MAG: TetR/AcrR family transcriptional regulator [Bacteriovoracaceae bacterium]|nr:TetR/AcrR family transcriptional regulator [Bacteriovoracaceae bacterium]
MPRSKREQLMDAALDLFMEKGFKATGIEAILKEARVAKMTLYKHFSSKDELVLAVLRRQDEEIRNRLFSIAKKSGKNPLSQITGLFEGLSKLVGKKYNGCLFTKASFEYKNDNQSIKRFSIEHKSLIKEFIDERLVELKISDESVGTQIMILYNGSLNECQMMDCKDPLIIAQKMVADLITRNLEARTND